MPRMTSQILEAMDFIKTQESRYLEKQRLIFFFKQKINYTSKTTLLQKIVCSRDNL